MEDYKSEHGDLKDPCGLWVFVTVMETELTGRV